MKSHRWRWFVLILTWSLASDVLAASKTNLYIVDQNSEHILVIDADSGLGPGISWIGKHIKKLAVSPDQTRIVVAREGASDLTVIDPSRNEVVDIIRLYPGCEPLDIAFADDNLLLVVVHRANPPIDSLINKIYRAETGVVAIDLRQGPFMARGDVNTYLRRIGAVNMALGTPVQLIVSPAYKYVCVVGEIPERDYGFPYAIEVAQVIPGQIFDYETGEEKFMATRDAFCAAISPDGRYIYADLIWHSWVKWDLKEMKGEKLPLINFDGYYYRSLDLLYMFDRPDILYNVKLPESVLDDLPGFGVIDLKASKATWYPLPAKAAAVAYAKKRNCLFFAHPDARKISVFDLTRMKVVRELDLSAHRIKPVLIVALEND